MKKISTSGKLCAFSLAEALITLLIVCLITLASIPILTKKKRQATDGGSGQWICTLAPKYDKNGNITSYKHVYYNSQTSEGDINDPSTWELAGDGSSCTFTPPLKAKNFGVTVIGGGGGGGEGISKLDKALEVGSGQTKTLSNPETGTYRLAVIGNGGGGAAANGRSITNKTIGGQGGGGGYWIGEIKLNSSESYKASVANMQNTSYPHSYKGSGMTSAYGNDTGWSTFSFLNGNSIVNAGSGGSGYSTVGNGFTGGIGGAGGTFNTNTAYHSILKTFKSGLGKTGRMNGYSESDRNRPFYQVLNASGGRVINNNEEMKRNVNGTILLFGYTDTGVSIPKEFWDGVSENGIFGAGGYGAQAPAFNGAEAGSAGTVLLWRVIQKTGKGGEASPLETAVIANIKGKLVATVGQGGKSGEDGKQTTATIYDSQGKAARIISSQYGKKGGQGETIAADSGYVNGEDGKNSLWLNKGGGAGGKCSAQSTSQEEGTCYADVPTQDCEIGFYLAGPVVTTTSQAPSGNIVKCQNGYNGTDIPCVGYEFRQNAGNVGNVTAQFADYKMFSEYAVWLRDTEYTSLNSLTQSIKNYHSGSGANYYLDKNFIVGASQNAATNSKYGGGTTSLHPDFNEADLYKVSCYKYKTKRYPYSCVKTVTHPPECSDGGNGTYFGAGGGGGGSSNTLNLKGKGGTGAPGAVIIEW